MWRPSGILPMRIVTVGAHASQFYVHSRGFSVSDEVPFVDLKAQYRSLSSDIMPAVESVFQSAAFVMGPDLTAFEEEFSTFIGAKHCVGVESGTAALKLAMQAIGIKAGDEVIIPANTYIACAFAVSQIGAVPVFVDMDENYLIDISSIEGVITSRTKAIMAVHLYGQAVDLVPLMLIASKRGLKIVEDASQAHGAFYRGKRVGSYGDVTAFSFYPGKNLGAYGDGGAVVTNDDSVADQVRLIRDFGQRKKYEHLLIGDNCRLDTVQAAILRVKLRHLDSWNARRHAAAVRYGERLAEIGLKPPSLGAQNEHVHHLYVVEVPERDAASAFLAQRGIQTGIHYPIPIHLQKAYAHLGIGSGKFPKTEKAAKNILSLPMFPEITHAQVDRVVDSLKEYLATANAAASF